MSVVKVTWRTKAGISERWMVRYVDADGERRFKNFKLKRDADAYDTQVKVDVSRGFHIAPSQSPNVAQAAARWIHRVETEKRELSTIKQYRQHVDKHIVPRIGSIKLASLTPAKVEDFRDDLQGALSKALARKVLTSLKSILKVAKYSHVAAGVSIKRDAREHKVEAGRDFPMPNEIRRLIEAVQGDDAVTVRLRALLHIAAFTGLRASELRGLRWQDVDFKARVLTVAQRADRFRKIGQPKSARSRRTVPLTPEVITALRAWQIASEHKAGLVFASISGGAEHHWTIMRAVLPAMKAAKMPAYGLHGFRHFFASWCLNPPERGGLGLQSQDVQRLLGHSSIVMTMDVYGHLFPGGDHHDRFAAGSQALFTGR
jgi:integrase